LHPATYKALFDIHYQPLCNFAKKYVTDMDKAEDIVQDVFVKLWNTRDTIDDAKSIKSLIFTMVKNRCLEVIRRENINKKAITHLTIVTDDSDYIIDDEEANKWLLIDQIYVSMRHLPPKCEEVFRMAKINGLSYTQIADELNISIKTVEGHMSKALKILREKLTSSIK
jgi:RNA polymerase sigma-70 factor (ECF subfamily)